jgi:hypothetical protein
MGGHGGISVSANVAHMTYVVLYKTTIWSRPRRPLVFQ